MSVNDLVVSWSEIDTGRQCRFKHQLAYKQRYTNSVKDDSALGKGVLWHMVMETHYKVIHASQKLVDGSVKWVQNDKELSYERLEELCEQAVDYLLSKAIQGGHDLTMIGLVRWMYEGYVATYGLDPDHDIMGVETTHLVPLGEIKIHGADVPVVLKFKIDRTVRDKFGVIRVIDEKSCANLPKDADFDFMDQFGLYVWGLRKLGINVRSAIHSAARTTRNQGDIYSEGDEGWKKTMKAQTLEERFRRTSINYTGPQLDDIARSALADVQDLYSESNKHQRQADSDRCKWRCSFTEACLFGRRTGKPGDTIRMLELQGFTQNFERH